MSAVAVYAALEGIEAVGLWLGKRWAEYLTFIATIVFIPYEIDELTKGVSALKLVTFVHQPGHRRLPDVGQAAVRACAAAGRAEEAERERGLRLGGHRARHPGPAARPGRPGTVAATQQANWTAARRQVRRSGDQGGESARVPDRVGMAVIIKINKHIAAGVGPFAAAVGPPAQVSVAVRAGVQVLVVGAVQAGVGEAAVTLSRQGRSAPLITQ